MVLKGRWKFLHMWNIYSSLYINFKAAVNKMVMSQTVALKYIETKRNGSVKYISYFQFLWFKKNYNTNIFYIFVYHLWDNGSVSSFKFASYSVLTINAIIYHRINCKLIWACVKCLHLKSLFTVAKVTKPIWIYKKLIWSKYAGYGFKISNTKYLYIKIL